MARRLYTLSRETWSVMESRSGVRASIVVMKPGNFGGAKGRRKVDALSLCLRKPNQR